MGKKVVLFSLQTFSSMGGIQKMTRTLSHALNVLAKRNNWSFELWSVYDSNNDVITDYLPAENFKGFKKKRTLCTLKTILAAPKLDIVILSHVNLAVLGILVKMINPKCEIWLIAHGIEVWRPLSKTKNLFLKRCDKIISVSEFTRQQMILRHPVNEEKCFVLNNAIDPFLKLPTVFSKPEHLLKRHRFKDTTPVILTLTRLASSEQYKGHDQVIKALGNLKSKFPDLKYILAGKHDHKEEIRIQKLISNSKVDEELILTGFVEDNELSDYFLLADLFVLPSKKEGFGIVFIEAMANGLPVICGNADGSVDAIRNGELGTAINPDSPVELEAAIINHLENPVSLSQRKELQEKCLRYFNEDVYISNLEKLFFNA
ncbi:glycosyltransferase involved in cell wall biosynthesis [Mucilaginibacter frigoritolerans]|jgi:phosphatidyl-myo-inositol dimannoside synthase|uniref:Glycosyltransferase involved in cell wall biosynthesis n=1 Tax=Mucilaginibacter frigoritolerans TaxID=652788 RepID=A0A562U0H2_9SPHI|nr:glycosyltransferase family 4 protein [Mucilaginibacter frigoritolerans]TWI99267.1 glycosyltransferase involved in cell wall biosynthesis [Mucilaginibacter frigoritolerans]